MLLELSIGSGQPSPPQSSGPAHINGHKGSTHLIHGLPKLNLSQLIVATWSDGSAQPVFQNVLFKFLYKKTAMNNTTINHIF